MALTVVRISGSSNSTLKVFANEEIALASVKLTYSKLILTPFPSTKPNTVFQASNGEWISITSFETDDIIAQVEHL